MKKPKISLSTEDSLILQQISESGEEDIISLSRNLGMQRGRVLAGVNSLRRKGLVVIQRTAEDWWVQASTKGKQVSHYIWPEMSYSSAF